MEETMMIITIGDAHEHSHGNEGSEMNVMGYDTKNFHICPGAKESFSSMIKEGYRDQEADDLINLAMLVDDYLGMEIEALESGSSPELIKDMVNKGNGVMFHLGSFAGRLGNEGMIGLFDFMPGHILKAMGVKDEPVSLEDQEYDMPMEEMNEDHMSMEIGGGSC